MKENADKARALGEPELAKKLQEDSEQMFRLRFQLTMGQTDGLKKLRSLRRERARMLTVQREREIEKSARGRDAASAAKAAPVKAKKTAAKAAVKKAVPVEPAVKKAVAKKTAAKPAAKKSVTAKAKKV